MGCCGSKRAAASAAAGRPGGGAPPRTVAPGAGPAAAGRPADVIVRYVGARPVRARGAASGRSYQTSPADPLVAIDARDAAALIRTGLFRAQDAGR